MPRGKKARPENVSAAPRAAVRGDRRLGLPSSTHHEPCAGCGTRFTVKRLLAPTEHPDVLFCRDCYDGVLSRWGKQANRAAQLDRYYQGQYRIDLNDYGRRFLHQGGKCAICAEPQGDKLLCVDHDHDTGEVRGLLCRNCNAAIGMLKDSPTRLAAAIIYLERNRCQSPQERSA